MYGTAHGVGQHIGALSAPQIVESLKGYFISELLYVTTTCLIKVSFSLMLLRITEKRWIAWGVWFVIIVTVVFSVFYFFFILFACDPVNFFWLKPMATSPLDGHCRDPIAMTKATYAHGAVMCFGDIALAVLPLFVIQGLHMQFKQKLSVFGLLALGSFTSIATIARLPEVHNLAEADFTYKNLTIAVWSVVEANVAIIMTALATLRPLMTKIGFMNSTNNASGHGQSSQRSYRLRGMSKGGSIDPNISEEDRLYDQYYPGAGNGPRMPQQPKPYRTLGFGHNKDSVKVPSEAS